MKSRDVYLYALGVNHCLQFSICFSFCTEGNYRFMLYKMEDAQSFIELLCYHNNHIDNDPA